MPRKTIEKPPYGPTRVFRVHRVGEPSHRGVYRELRSKTYSSVVFALDHLKALRNDGAEESELWIGEVNWRKATPEEVADMERNPRQ